MNKINLPVVLVAYVTLGAIIAICVSESNSLITWNPEVLPPLLLSISERSVNPIIWRNYFSIMSMLSVASIPFFWIAVNNQMGAPKTTQIIPLAVALISIGLIMLYWLLNIEIASDTKIIFFRAMFQSKYGLGLQGSTFLAGIMSIFAICFIVPAIGLYRHLKKHLYHNKGK